MAGKDLTGELKAALWGAALLERIPMVGTLADTR
jgi:predicted heme/steroid binding protein